MEKRKGILILFVCATTFSLVLFATRTHEPRYNGKSLNYWVSQYGRSRTLNQPEAEAQASDAISHIGTNGLPLLLARMHCEDQPGKLRLAAQAILDRAPPSLVPDAAAEWASEDPKIRMADYSAIAFEALGKRALPAMPALTRMINDAANPLTATRAQYALALIGPEALPVLVEALRNPAASNRVDAACYIALVPHLRSNAGPALPVLIHCLNDGDATVRDYCVRALANTNFEPGLVVPAFREVLRSSKNSSTRRRVMYGLSTFGHRAVDARPELITALADPDGKVRQGATNALRLIAPEAFTNAPPP